MKLQQAYFSEKVMYGTWTLIGYSGPGSNAASTSVTTNFTYDGTGIDAETTEADQVGWSATNKARLNDCESGAHWQVATGTITNDKDAYQVTMESDDDGACASLTPNFTAIGN